jgi:hypothetical protein
LAKVRLKRAFELEVLNRLRALEDEDLEAVWGFSLNQQHILNSQAYRHAKKDE